MAILPGFGVPLFGAATIIGIREKRSDRIAAQQDVIELDCNVVGAVGRMRDHRSIKRKGRNAL
jgi:hypothetical protein